MQCSVRGPDPAPVPYAASPMEPVLARVVKSSILSSVISVVVTVVGLAAAEGDYRLLTPSLFSMTFTLVGGIFGIAGACARSVGALAVACLVAPMAGATTLSFVYVTTQLQLQLCQTNPWALEGCSDLACLKRTNDTMTNTCTHAELAATGCLLLPGKACDGLGRPGPVPDVGHMALALLGFAASLLPATYALLAVLRLSNHNHHTERQRAAKGHQCGRSALVAADCDRRFRWSILA